MDENILGKNIKHMRTLHGETLDELGMLFVHQKARFKGMRKEDVYQILLP